LTTDKFFTAKNHTRYGFNNRGKWDQLQCRLQAIDGIWHLIYSDDHDINLYYNSEAYTKPEMFNLLTK